MPKIIFNIVTWFYLEQTIVEQQNKSPYTLKLLHSHTLSQLYSQGLPSGFL